MIVFDYGFYDVFRRNYKDRMFWPEAERVRRRFLDVTGENSVRVPLQEFSTQIITALLLMQGMRSMMDGYSGATSTYDGPLNEAIGFRMACAVNKTGSMQSTVPTRYAVMLSTIDSLCVDQKFLDKLTAFVSYTDPSLKESGL